MADRPISYVERGCDIHQVRKDEWVTGAKRFTIAQGGLQARGREIDLCEGCQEELGIPRILEVLDEVNPPKGTRPGKPRQSGGAGYKPHAVDPPGSGHQCPDCDSEFTTLQGLGSHRSSAHGYVSPTRAARMG